MIVTVCYKIDTWAKAGSVLARRDVCIWEVWVKLSDENIMKLSNDPIDVIYVYIYIYVNRFKLGPFPDLTGNWEKISVTAQ